MRARHGLKEFALSDQNQEMVQNRTLIQIRFVEIILGSCFESSDATRGHAKPRPGAIRSAPGTKDFVPITLCSTYRWFNSRVGRTLTRRERQQACAE